LVRDELTGVTDPKVRAKIEDFLVEPYCVFRDWDYGEPGTQFPCWTVLEHPASNTGIAYCEEGFGPANPWGLVFLLGEYLSIGMDAAWFAYLEDAFRDSHAWEDENPPGWEVR
jgi:hypothetical protein